MQLKYYWGGLMNTELITQIQKVQQKQTTLPVRYTSGNHGRCRCTARDVGYT